MIISMCFLNENMVCFIVLCVQYSSSYGEWGTEMHASENSHYDYERRNYSEQPEYSELEPYEPTWSQFPGYLQDYKDEVPHEYNKVPSPIFYVNFVCPVVFHFLIFLDFSLHYVSGKFLKAIY